MHTQYPFNNAVMEWDYCSNNQCYV